MVDEDVGPRSTKKNFGFSENARGSRAVCVTEAMRASVT